MVSLLILLPVLAAADGPSSSTAVHAYRGARIHVVAGPVIDRGTLVVQNGRILDVGPEDKVVIPAGAVVHDLSGKTVIPGLVDTHSHIGIFQRPGVPAHQDGNEMTGPVQPGLRALDAIWPGDPGIRMALAGGVTTANIMPGSGNVIGGQTLYVKLRGDTVEIMRIPHPEILGGLKMANGENPKGYGRRSPAQAPSTRMKVAALQREQFMKALAYQARWLAYRRDSAEGKKVTPPETDIALQPLVEVLERKRTVHFHCHRADDLMTALRLQQEFGFEMVLQHATEAYRVADELVKRKVPVSLTLVDSPGGKFEVAGLLEENAAILEKAGVKVCINTDDFITESRFFLRTGAIAVRGGMSEDAALRALTLHGTQVMHLENRLGSLEKGKDADFVVLSGPPFSVYTRVLETYIDGVKVFDRARHEDWTYQTGGYALADPERLPKEAGATKPLPSVKAPSVSAVQSVPAMPKRLAVFAGRIHTVAQGTITDGVILVEDGKITAVGPRDKVLVPKDMPRLAAAEVTPGLIDAHCVIGVSGRLNVAADQDQDEAGDPNQADLRVIDSFNPNEPFLRFVREQGVTVIHAMPGRTNVIAGQTGVFRTYGRSAEQMAINPRAALLINLGEIPKQAYAGRRPSTRMGTAGLIRAALAEARDYLDRKTKLPDKAPNRNLKTEAVARAVLWEMPVVFSAQRMDDLQTALRLSEEFKLRPILGLATEAYLMADALAGANVPVLVHPTMQRPATLETVNAHLGNAAALADRKVPVAIGTAFEGYVPKTRVLRYEAAVAMVNGLGHARALAAITLEPAKILGISDRFGSLEVGKVADLVLYDGDPFEHTTHVTHTVIDGRIVYDRAAYLKLPFARRVLPLVGGDGVGCCMGEW